MGFNKKKGISTVTALIILAIFNIAAFLLPLNHSVTFWIGYSFVTLSVILFVAVMLFLFDTKEKNKLFLRLPLVTVSWIYLLLQIILGIWQIPNFTLPYFVALIINCLLTGFFIIAVLTSKAAGDSIAKKDEQVSEKSFFIQNMQVFLSSVKTDNEELAGKINLLADDFRFSDPMSHSLLSELEKQIEAKVIILKSDVSDFKKASKDIDCISDLLKERNQKCKLLKNKPEADNTKDNSGVKYVSVTIGVLGAFAMVAIIICFIVIPNNTYKTAMSLYDEKQYDEALQIFENLDSFRNSDEMIETIEQEQKENKYNDAEANFENQNYVEAIKLYTQLGDYKDSKQKIEQINNRLATDDSIYFGSYQGEPIAWQIIETDNNKMLLISKEPVCELPYNDELKNVSWNDSFIYEWLNSHFLQSFSQDQLQAILSAKIDGNNIKVFLLSEDEAENLEDDSILSCETDWWLRTKSDTNAVYVMANGQIEEDGDTVIRSKGVRPCIWIDLT